MTSKPFQGVITALVTPFADGRLDEPAFVALIERQVAAGVHGVVPVGTTGETSTLSHEEHKRVVSLCVEVTNGRIPVIAGAGSNSTEEAVDFARHAKAAGADASLVVTPYYNRPGQEGLYQHYKTISDAVDLPMLVYNVPSRTSIDITNETLLRVAELPNVVGIKDATGDMVRASLQKRFFDYFLKGEGDWQDQPLVSLNIRQVDGTVTLRRENEWPLARTEWTRKYLNLDTNSIDASASIDSKSITYSAMGEGVTFFTTPLTEATEITGPVSAKVWVSSSTTDADLFLTLRAFGDDGNEILFEGANDPKTPMSQGWLRASHRALDVVQSKPWAPFHPHKVAEPIIPGQIYELDIEIWATCLVLPAGYRLALTVKGCDFDHGLEPVEMGGRIMKGSGPFRHEHPEDRPAAIFENQVTLYTGDQYPSSILLPIIPA